VSRLPRLKGLKIKGRRSAERMWEHWQENAIKIVDVYLFACLEKDLRNLFYSYDTGCEKFNLHRIVP
jgi:hypothetical protein